MAATIPVPAAAAKNTSSATGAKHEIPKAIRSPGDWEELLDKTWMDAENFAILIEQLPEAKLGEIFTDEKYGNYYRNIHGIIEHTHYHLGQIVLIKKLLSQANGTNEERDVK